MDAFGSADDDVAFARAVGIFTDVSSGEATVPGSPGPFDVDRRDDDPDEGETKPRPEVEVIVPIAGMRMEPDSIELPGATLVRADGLDHPPSEALGAPDNVFAVIGSVASPQGDAAAVADGTRAIRILRLFKAGGVGLAPHGWARKDNEWTRFPTGVARPRPGGYELSAAELPGLLDLASRMVERRERFASFDWATSRFDLGSQRPNQIEALSDYLLVLRGLLEGGGPAKAVLEARAAALTAEIPERAAVRATVERALAIERKLMSGSRGSAGSPLAVIAEIETMLRNLLREMASGQLGSDLRITADEILLADGLHTADETATQLGGTAEWEIAQPHLEETAQWQLPDLEDAEISIERFAGEPIEAGNDADPVEAETMIHDQEIHDEEKAPRSNTPGPPWLDDSDDRDLEWPAFASPRPEGRRNGQPSERVRFLFPVPENTDWSIGELDQKLSRGA